MELRHLRYFVAVAELRHFTRAAEQLGIGQPPLSQQIQALERELGTQLFTRLPRGVNLTAAGEALLDDAHRILRDVERAIDRTQRVARGEIGRLRVGMINSAPFHPLIPEVIREFRRQYPNVTLTLDEGATPNLATAIRSDVLDVAFVRPLLRPESGLASKTLLNEDLVVVLPQGHPLTRRKQVPLAALSSEPFVLFPRSVGAGLHEEILHACSSAGFVPRVLQETSQVTSIVNLVAAGLGVSLVPASMQQMHTAGVTYRPLQKPAPIARLCLIYREDQEDSPQIQNLLQLTELHRKQHAASVLT